MPSRIPVSRVRRYKYFSHQKRVPYGYGVNPNRWSDRAKLDKKYCGGYVDEKYDLTEKDKLDEAENMRQVPSRDFYQDHTYFTQWNQREYTHSQKQEVKKQYGWMAEGFIRDPWVWYPGDLVEIIGGEFAGHRGSILNIVKYKNEVCIQNVNVKSITVPAGENRPEQNIQREHPIHVDFVKHVDPETNQPCDVRLVTVRNKETGEKETKRISLQSGYMFNIPAKEGSTEGDPLNDTPLQDAEEPTYKPDEEIPVLAQRKLRVMEEHFIQLLKSGHEYHDKLQAENAKYMEKYNYDLWTHAADKMFSRMRTEKRAKRSGGMQRGVLPQLEADEIAADEAAS